MVDTDAGRIFVFDGQGQHVRSFAEWGKGPAQLKEAESIVVDGAGQVFVSDEASSRICVFDLEGNFKYCFSSRGKGRGELVSDPEGLALDSRGYLLCLDEGEGRLEVFRADGGHVTTLGDGVGSEPGELDSPDGLFYESDEDRVWIVDQGNSRVQRIPLGELLGSARD